MNIKPVQECRSLEGWVPIEVESSSSDNKYLVLVNPWGDIEGNICECPGYHYTGHCRHQEEAHASICAWKEGQDPQTDEDKRAKICPRCGGPTRWIMEYEPE